MNVWGDFVALRRRWIPIAAIASLAALIGSVAVARAESEFANPGSIEGLVTKTGGTRLKGVEVCAFDVAEYEEFTECALSKSNGRYEINGLGEGPYRVEFKSGSSGLNLATQWWKNASSAGKATIVRIEENDITDIDATMSVAPVTTGVMVGGVLEPDVDGDGAGDITQDRCPQSKAFQTACPVVSFLPGHQERLGKITVKVKSSVRTQVVVVANSPRSVLKAGKQELRAGTPTDFSVQIPASLQYELDRLDRRRSIPIFFHARADEVEGAPSTDEFIVRLPGRA